jgi:alpha-methylacyl-CoA racemase
MSGPLAGVRVIELASIGPVPHAGMVLADLGADVVRVERPGFDPENTFSGIGRDQVLRSTRYTVLDLKLPPDVADLLALVEHADVFIEGYRPGVTERLGVGPRECQARNPRLVYGRMTGWGAAGPRSGAAGHDINYLSVTGALNAFGAADQRPVPPINLLGDYGGGSMLLVCGILAALVERQTSGTGQVVEAAMVDGVSLLMQAIWAWRGTGFWSDVRGANLLDSGAPFYDTYVCADGRYVAVGAIEPQFYARLLAGLELDSAQLPAQQDRSGWPALRAAFTRQFASRTRDEWAAHFAALDACVTPVLDFVEATRDEHIRARGTLIEVDDIWQAAPAPRFSRTEPDHPSPPTVHASPIESVIQEWASRRR